MSIHPLQRISGPRKQWRGYRRATAAAAAFPVFPSLLSQLKRPARFLRQSLAACRCRPGADPLWFGFRATMMSCRRQKLFRTCPEHLAEMDQAAYRQAGNACFVAGVDRFGDTKQGRQFRPGEISPLAGFPDTGGDSFQRGAESNSTVRGW